LLVEPQLWADLRAGLAALPPDPVQHALAVPMAARAALLRLQRDAALGCLPGPRA
jgi:hypothetical protein